MTESNVQKSRRATRRKPSKRKADKPVEAEGALITKRIGRPPTGVGVLIGVRVHPADLAMLDEWRETEPDMPGRPEAIRRLINIALKWRGPRR
jgi:hypothetical protein